VTEFEKELVTLDSLDREVLEPLRVSPRRVPVDDCPGETVVVVAEHDGQILYWSDVELGWELEVPSPSGGVSARGASQFDLSHIAYRLRSSPPASS